MNENAKKWVAALRSGDYKRAKGALCRKRKEQVRYCCLGVACDIYQKEVGDLQVIERPINGGFVKLSFDGAASTLPRKVQVWLGLHGPEGGYGYRRALTVDNDRRKKFPAIADIIESEPEGLFDG